MAKVERVPTESFLEPELDGPNISCPTNQNRQFLS